MRGDDVADVVVARAQRTRRALFMLTVVLGGAIFWLAPHPPMIDLPQHAGQVAALRDLVLGKSPWTELVRLNFFTPYLIGYGLALPLSLVMPIAAALKLLLTLGYWAFVAAGVLLRKRFKADERLDWLIVPAYFGFAYKWGFYTFLLAAPIGLLFILLAKQYADAPEPRRALVLFATGMLLFFSHALVFLFACAVGTVLLVLRLRSWARRFVPVLLPYAGLAALCIVYGVVSLKAEAPITAKEGVLYFGWDWKRAAKFFLYPLGSSEDPWVAPLTLFLLAVPWLLGLRIDAREPWRLAPFAVVVGTWLAMPSFGMKIAYLYERFALFMLPCYVLMFRSAPAVQESGTRERRGRWVTALTVLLCWGFLGVKAARTLRFADETRDFDEVAAAAQPGRLALTLVFDTVSSAANNRHVYLHYPVWYQAEQGGFVEFNFAWAQPQIVRYRLDRLPAVEPGGLEWRPQKFDWNRYAAARYDYFFVRHTEPLKRDYFQNAQCAVTQVAAAGTWALYERKGCR
jgi:hypothetical protein